MSFQVLMSTNLFRLTGLSYWSDMVPFMDRTLLSDINDLLLPASLNSLGMNLSPGKHTLFVKKYYDRLKFQCLCLITFLNLTAYVKNCFQRHPLITIESLCRRKSHEHSRGSHKHFVQRSDRTRDPTRKVVMVNDLNHSAISTITCL